MNDRLYGGIEAGGTKFICAVGTSPDAITNQIQIPTTSPSETLEKVVSFFAAQPKLQAIGIASFGPLDLDKNSQQYGFITSTPKLDWVNTDLVGAVNKGLNVPVNLNTDVNCAALAEQQHGAAQGLSNVAYMTVGTGIGVGCIVGGKILQGITNTELGHMLIPKDPSDNNFKGSCPYHNDLCLEGLASGIALEKRWGMLATDQTDNSAWSLEAHYLAVGIYNVITYLAPERIIVGGGVMNHPDLLTGIKKQLPSISNGYIKMPEMLENIDDYIVKPGLGSLSGVAGALAIAIEA